MKPCLMGAKIAYPVQDLHHVAPFPGQGELPPKRYDFSLVFCRSGSFGTARKIEGSANLNRLVLIIENNLSASTRKYGHIFWRIGIDKKLNKR